MTTGMTTGKTGVMGRARAVLIFAIKSKMLAGGRLSSNAASPPSGKLTAVSCTGVGSCLAVGGYVDNAGNIQIMLVREKWPLGPGH